MSRCVKPYVNARLKTRLISCSCAARSYLYLASLRSGRPELRDHDFLSWARIPLRIWLVIQSQRIHFAKLQVLFITGYFDAFVPGCGADSSRWTCKTWRRHLGSLEITTWLAKLAMVNIQSWQSIGPIGANQVADSAHKFTSRRLSLGPLGPIGGWWLLELLDVNMWVVHFVVSGAGRYTSKGYSKAEMAWNRNGTKKCGSHESHDTDTIRIQCQKFWSSSRSSRSQQGHV